MNYVSGLIIQFLISSRLSPAVMLMNNVVAFDQYLAPNTRLRLVRLWYTCVFISSYLIGFLIVHFHILPIFTHR